MKNVLVVSDSHGNKENLKTLIETGNYDYVFFLGDLISDVSEVKHNNLIKVRGNWDVNFTVKGTEVLQIEGVKIMLTHGHAFGVKTGIDKLISKAKKLNVKLVCYGHTHVANFVEVDGIGFLNPGAYSSFKGGKGTCATLKIDGEKIYVNM